MSRECPGSIQRVVRGSLAMSRAEALLVGVSKPLVPREAHTPSWVAGRGGKQVLFLPPLGSQTVFPVT